MLFQQLLFYFFDVLKTEQTKAHRGLDFSTVYFATYAPPYLDFLTCLCYYIYNHGESRGSFRVLPCSSHITEYINTFHSQYMEVFSLGKIVMNYWDCPHCGNTTIPGSSQSCPSCGHTRDGSVKFYPPGSRPNTPKVYVTDPVKAERLRNSPDWNCSFCGNLVNHYQKQCPGCGHTREESDKHYFDLHPERRDAILPLSGDEPSSDDDEEYHRSTEDEDEDEERPHSTGGGRHMDMKRIGIGLLIAVLVVGIIVGAWYIFSPKERYITVEDIYWNRTIDIQEYRTVRESDWYVPAGGRVQYTQQEIHHYERVLDHYDEVTKSREVACGSHEEVVGYRDLGNGYSEEITRTVTDYRTEYYTEREPVYRQDPVYQTKYYYDIERWVYNRSVYSSAHDQEPYWPSYTLADNERTSTTHENYKIKARYEDKTDDYSMEYKEWIETYVGNELHVLVHFGGRIELIMDEPESEPTKIPEP